MTSESTPFTVRTVGVVGAGMMGTGIAQVALGTGHEVRLHDQSLDALSAGSDLIIDGLTRGPATSGRDTDWIRDDWTDDHLRSRWRSWQARRISLSTSRRPLTSTLRCDGAGPSTRR